MTVAKYCIHYMSTKDQSQTPAKSGEKREPLSVFASVYYPMKVMSCYFLSGQEAMGYLLLSVNSQKATKHCGVDLLKANGKLHRIVAWKLSPEISAVFGGR